MRSATAALLLAFFLSYPIPLLAQCQAGAISAPGVCNNNGGGGTEYVYGHSTTTALYGNANFNSSIVIDDPYWGHVTRVVAFNSSGTNVATNVYGIQIVPFDNAVGVACAHLYYQGKFVMTIVGNDSASIAAFQAWIVQLLGTNPTYWNTHYNWLTNVYWAVKAGGASSACNAATLELEGTTLLWYTSILGGGPFAAVNTVGGFAIYLAQLKRVAADCPY
jgi:hypothetical protein